MTFPVDELNSEYTTLSTLKTLKTPRQRIASSFRNGNDCCAVQVKLREAEKVRCGPLFPIPLPSVFPARYVQNHHHQRRDSLRP
jgi:hypothetical protein